MLHLPKMLGFAIVIFAVFQDSPAVEKDAKRLQGSWEVVSMLQGGKEIPGLKKEGKMIFTFEGSKAIVKLGGKVLNEGTYKIDPGKTPRTIDLVDDRKEPTLGIYEATDDEIKLCMGGRGKERPKEFAAPPGTDQSLVTLKRMKSPN